MEVPSYSLMEMVNFYVFKCMKGPLRDNAYHLEQNRMTLVEPRNAFEITSITVALLFKSSTSKNSENFETLLQHCS